LPLQLRRDGFDPVEELARARDGEGVARAQTPFGVPAYLVCRHEDVRRVLSDPARFSSALTPLFPGSGQMYLVTPAFPAHARHAPPPRFFGLMKATTLFVAAALLTQAITAGQLLSNEGGRQLHHATGGAVSVALALQIIAALLVWRVGHGPARYLAVSASMVLLTGV
ncbi:hypothetical protein JYK22_40995, partial [Nonomuraea sp. RK-328]|nr:hypothetical protein [Nonomuraea sp. RK-328]